MPITNHIIVLQRTLVTVGKTTTDERGNFIEDVFPTGYVKYDNGKICHDVIAKFNISDNEHIYLVQVFDDEWGSYSFYIVNNVPIKISPNDENIYYTNPLDAENEMNAYIEFAEILRKHYRA